MTRAFALSLCLALMLHQTASVDRVVVAPSGRVVFGHPADRTSMSPRQLNRQLTTAHPTSTERDGHIDIDWSWAVERLDVSSPTQLAQSFTFRERPAVDSDLEISWQVDGPFSIGPATWIDADGRRTDIAVTLGDGLVSLLVPEALVERSTFPAVLDPVLSATITLPPPAPTPATSLVQHHLVADQQGPVVVVGRDDFLECHPMTDAGASTGVFGLSIAKGYSLRSTTAANGVLASLLIDVSAGPGHQLVRHTRDCSLLGSTTLPTFANEQSPFDGGWLIYGPTTNPDGGLHAVLTTVSVSPTGTASTPVTHALPGDEAAVAPIGDDVICVSVDSPPAGTQAVVSIIDPRTQSVRTIDFKPRDSSAYARPVAVGAGNYGLALWSELNNQPRGYVYDVSGAPVTALLTPASDRFYSSGADFLAFSKGPRVRRISTTGVISTPTLIFSSDDGGAVTDFAWGPVPAMTSFGAPLQLVTTTQAITSPTAPVFPLVAIPEWTKPFWCGFEDRSGGWLTWVEYAGGNSGVIGQVFANDGSALSAAQRLIPNTFNLSNYTTQCVDRRVFVNETSIVQSGLFSLSPDASVSATRRNSAYSSTPFAVAAVGAQVEIVTGTFFFQPPPHNVAATPFAADGGFGFSRIIATFANSPRIGAVSFGDRAMATSGVNGLVKITTMADAGTSTITYDAGALPINASNSRTVRLEEGVCLIDETNYVCFESDAGVRFSGAWPSQMDVVFPDWDGERVVFSACGPDGGIWWGALHADGGVQLRALPTRCQYAQSFAPGKLVILSSTFIDGGLFYPVEQPVIGIFDYFADGRSCAQDEQCISGFCSDGVCCHSDCGHSDPTDCSACSITAGGSADGLCTPVAGATLCRAASNECDVEERCNGVALTCSVNALALDGTGCTGGTCQSGVCTPAAIDGGVDAGSPDAGIDDGGFGDAGSGDSGVAEDDGGFDGGIDSGVESGLDSGFDAGTMVTADAGVVDDGGALPDPREPLTLRVGCDCGTTSPVDACFGLLALWGVRRARRRRVSHR